MSPDERARWSRENSHGAETVDFPRCRGKLREVLEKRVDFLESQKRLDFCDSRESAVSQNEIAVLSNLSRGHFVVFLLFVRKGVILNYRLF